MGFKLCCLLSHLFHGHALMTDDFCFMSVHLTKKKKKNRTKTKGGGRVGWWETPLGVLENKCIVTSMLGAICFGCMSIWMLVSRTKMCCCNHPPRFATVQGSWFIMADAPFLCNEAVTASEWHWQTVSMATRAHPFRLHQPFLPRPPWHLAETGPEKSILRLSASAAWRARNGGGGRERKWRLFLHAVCGFLSVVFLGLAKWWKKRLVGSLHHKRDHNTIWFRVTKHPACYWSAESLYIQFNLRRCLRLRNIIAWCERSTA